MAHRSVLVLTACLAVLPAPAWAGAQTPASVQKGAVQAPSTKPTPASKPGAAGQKPAATRPPSKPKPATQPPAAGVVVLPGSSDTYSYRPEGRRDPFVSLKSTGVGPAPKCPEGPAGGLVCLAAGDIVLKGIVQSRGRFLALVQGPATKRPYIVRANDRFADGVVKAITADAMFILQEVTDPLSLTKQREIRKTLRALEEVK